MDLTSLDFQQARIKQVLYKSQLRSVLYGVRRPEEGLWLAEQNPLAQWILSVIGPRCADHPAYEQLVGELHRLLRTSHELVAQYQRGGLLEARAGLSRIDASSDRISALLRQLEEAAPPAG